MIRQRCYTSEHAVAVVVAESSLDVLIQVRCSDFYSSYPQGYRAVSSTHTLRVLLVLLLVGNVFLSISTPIAPVLDQKTGLNEFTVAYSI